MRGEARNICHGGSHLSGGPDADQRLESSLDRAPVFFIGEPLQGVGDLFEHIAQRPRGRIVAPFELLREVIEHFQPFLQGIPQVREDLDDVFLDLFQRGLLVLLAFRVQVLVEGVEDRVDIPGYVHENIAPEFNPGNVFQPFPFFLDLIDRVVEVAHPIDVVCRRPEAALLRVEFVQAVLHGLPVIGKVEHLRGALAKDLETGGVPAESVHLAQGVHDGHGVLPAVGVFGSADAGQGGDLLLIDRVDLGDQLVQILQGSTHVANRAGILLNGVDICVPVARQIHDIVILGGHGGHLFDHHGHSFPDAADRIAEQVFQRAGNSFARVADLAQAVREAVRRHRAQGCAVLDALQFVAGVGQAVLHVRQGRPGVIQLLLPFGDSVLVIAVFLPDFLQGVPVGLDDPLLLFDLLLQAFDAGLVLLLGRGVIAHFGSLGLQLASQGAEVPLGLPQRRPVFLLTVQNDFLPDVVIRHVLSSLFMCPSASGATSDRPFCRHRSPGS